MITSSFFRPYSRHFSNICLALSTLCFAVVGSPFSLSARPITAAPYFFTIGSMRSSLSSSAFTEFTIALPLYTRSPASIASGFDESICSGILTTDCTAFTASLISATSSPPGTPTFISSMSAPDSSSSIATLQIYSISWFKSASWNLFLPVGFSLSPTTLTPLSSTISFAEHIPVFTLTLLMSLSSVASSSDLSSFIKSGAVPQQPPAYDMPILLYSAISFAKSAA